MRHCKTEGNKFKKFGLLDIKYYYKLINQKHLIMTKTSKSKIFKLTVVLVFFLISFLIFREIFGDWEHFKDGLF